MSCTNSPEAVKKLLENMQSDLRALSLECKKKFPPVKEVCLRRRQGDGGSAERRERSLVLVDRLLDPPALY